MVVIVAVIVIYCRHRRRRRPRTNISHTAAGADRYHIGGRYVEDVSGQRDTYLSANNSTKSKLGGKRRISFSPLQFDDDDDDDDAR